MPKRNVDTMSTVPNTQPSQRSYKRIRKSRGTVGRMAVSKRWASRETRASVPKLDINPFPLTFRTTLTWHPPAANLAGSNNQVYQWKCNDAFDPDAGTAFGTSSQPLYFDQICSSTGPYKSFIVHGWRTRLEVINATGVGDTIPYQTLADAVELIVQQGYELSAEGDTNAELQSAPNRQVKLLAPALTSGAASKCVFYLRGKTSDYQTKPAYDSTLSGNYTGSPSIVIYGNLGARSILGDSFSLFVMMHHEFDVEFFNIDGAAS